jgi:hypothetical protein
MDNTNVHSATYQENLNRYITNIHKYQPGVNWYYDHFKRGFDRNGNPISEEQMKSAADAVSPMGYSIPPNEVIDITPSWEWLCEQFPDRFGYDESKFQQWISEQKDAFFYAREKHNFSIDEARQIAGKLGYRKMIVENLS